MCLYIVGSCLYIEKDVTSWVVSLKDIDQARSGPAEKQKSILQAASFTQSYTINHTPRDMIARAFARSELGVNHL